MVTLELRKSRSSNEHSFFILCSSDSGDMKSECRSDEISQSNTDSFESERDDCSIAQSFSKSDICIYHDPSMSTVEVTINNEESISTPESVQCSLSASQDNFHVRQVVYSKNDSLINTGDELHDVKKVQHNGKTGQGDEKDFTFSSRNNERLEEKIKRISRPTKSFNSYLAVGPTKPKEKRQEYQVLNIKEYDNVTFIQHLSRPTKGYLSYVSNGASGVAKGKRKKFDKRTESSKIVTDGKAEDSISKAEMSKANRLRKKVNTTTRKPYITQARDNICKSLSSSYGIIGNLESIHDLRVTKSESSFQGMIRRKARIASRQRNIPSVYERLYASSNEIKKPKYSQNYSTSKYRSSLQNMTSAKLSIAPVYERLYTSNKILTVDPLFNASSLTTRNTGGKIRNKQNLSCNEVHSRLYDYSKEYQAEGKKIRNEIAEKIRFKNEVKFSDKKISLERACRLYYIGMDAKRKRENVCKMSE